MTAKEKAVYLTQVITGFCCGCPHDAKTAAASCVDEILTELDRVGGYNLDISAEDGVAVSPNSRKDFWHLVKDEIEKIEVK